MALAKIVFHKNGAVVNVGDYDSFEIDTSSAIALEEMSDEGLSFQEALATSQLDGNVGVRNVLSELLPYVTDDFERLHNILSISDDAADADDIAVVSASEVVGQ